MPLINGPVAAGAPSAVTATNDNKAYSTPELSNPGLQAIQDQIERNLTSDNRPNYDKIVVAGMHLALDKGPQGLLAQLHNSRDPITDAAKGAVSLMLVMRSQAHGVMPMKAAVPAAMTLLLKALDFLERSGVIAVNQAVLERASTIFSDYLLARFGISREGLATAARRVNLLVQDPAAVKQMQIKAGMIPHPGAPTIAAPPAMANA
jgi:hypothetical protein